MLADHKQSVDRKPSFLIESILRVIDDELVSRRGNPSTPTPNTEPAPCRTTDIESDWKFESRKHRGSEEIVTKNSEAFDMRQANNAFASGREPLGWNTSLRPATMSSQCFMPPSSHHGRTTCDTFTSDWTSMIGAREDSNPSCPTSNVSFHLQSKKSSTSNDSSSQRSWVSPADGFSPAMVAPFDQTVPSSSMAVAAADTLYFLAGRQRHNDQQQLRRRQDQTAETAALPDDVWRRDSEHHFTAAMHGAILPGGYITDFPNTEYVINRRGGVIDFPHHTLNSSLPLSLFNFASSSAGDVLAAAVGMHGCAAGLMTSMAAAAAAAGGGGFPDVGGEFMMRMKCRRNRTVFTEHHLISLEKNFDRQKYLTTKDRSQLAARLGLSQIQVKTWYQNRRMKWKKQVLQQGGTQSPTKPKGRPRKHEDEQIANEMKTN